MNWRSVAAALSAVAALVGGVTKCSDRYDVEIHISRVWGPNDPLPERLR